MMARVSVWLLAGIPVGVAWLTVWAVRVDTSPTLSAEDRVRGWGTVARELPATVPLVAVPLLGLLLAVRAGRLGEVRRARTAVWLHGAALFFVLLVVLNGSAENIMTTRPSTVKWMLLPLQAGVAVAAIRLSLRAARDDR